ncbi:MAG TPA: FMN-binding protein [Gammaproteobacteria bacterium]|nr:FMN-binding protein [Gammaproteobacteria bacterium]
MRAELLITATAIMVVAPARATTYLSVEQAQEAIFPGAKFTPDFRNLSGGEISQIEKASDTTAYSREVKCWKVDQGGWFIVDEVVGKHEFITYALGLDAGGAVQGIEIMDYRETHGGEIREPAWRAQFHGKKHGEALKLEEDIQNISGATLSCKHITDGVRRLLTFYDLILKGR